MGYMQVERDLGDNKMHCRVKLVTEEYITTATRWRLKAWLQVIYLSPTQHEAHRIKQTTPASELWEAGESSELLSFCSDRKPPPVGWWPGEQAQVPTQIAVSPVPGDRSLQLLLLRWLGSLMPWPGTERYSGPWEELGMSAWMCCFLTDHGPAWTKHRCSWESKGAVHVCLSHPVCGQGKG